MKTNLKMIAGVACLTLSVLHAATFPAIFTAAGPQKRLLAERAAQSDAQRVLLEKIYGLRVEGGNTVRDFATLNDQIRLSAENSIRGVRFEGEPVFHEDGRVEVVAVVKLRQLVETITHEIKERRLAGLQLEPSITQVIEKNYREAEARAVGMGALEGSRGQQRLLARRAAQADAHRKLSARLHAIRIDSNTTVLDMVTTSDLIRARVDSMVRGAHEAGITFLPDDSAEVTMEITTAEIVERIALMAGRQIADGEIVKKTEVFREVGKGAPRPAAATDALTESLTTPGRQQGGTVIIERVIDDGVLIDR